MYFLLYNLQIILIQAYGHNEIAACPYNRRLSSKYIPKRLMLTICQYGRPDKTDRQARVSLVCRRVLSRKRL